MARYFLTEESFRYQRRDSPKIVIFGRGHRVSSVSKMRSYVCLPFGGIVARADEGLSRAGGKGEGFNCDRRTGDFLGSLDLDVGVVLRRRGSSSGYGGGGFHRGRRKSLFSLFVVPPRACSNREVLLVIPCTSKATRPDASRTRCCVQYPLSSSSFPPCARPVSLPTTRLYSVSPSLPS